MRNSTLRNKLFTLAALTALAAPAVAQTLPVKADPYAPIPFHVMTPIRTKALFKTPTASNAGIARMPRKIATQQTELINEDFSLVKGNAEQHPELVHYIDSLQAGKTVDVSDWIVNTYYNQNQSNDIPSELTKKPGFIGGYVAKADGAVALLAPGAKYDAQAFLASPAQDYSGSVTVTFRAKRFPGYKGNITLNGYVADLANNDYYEEDENASPTFRIFGSDDDWQYYTWTFDCHSSNPNYRITLCSYDMVIIDDLNIRVSADNFVAEPTMKGITDVTDSTFTINWNSVRAANTYLMGLKKKVWTSDQETARFFYPLKDGKIPADLKTDASAKIVTFKGTQVLTADTIQFPVNNATYKSMKLRLGVIAPATPDPDFDGDVIIQVLKDGKWSSNFSYVATYYTDTLRDVTPLASSFGNDENKYQGIRLVASNFPEGYKFAIDSVDITTNRPYDFEMVNKPGNFYTHGEHYGDPTYDPEYKDYTDWYVSSTITKPVTSYTFKNLDPASEYYYAVIARRYTTNSPYTWYHAFCVAAPKATEATDVDERGSYTANWTGPVKATRYSVTNYGVYQAKADEKAHALIDEDFSGIDANATTATNPNKAETIGNDYETVSFDDYTKLPGWTGICNSMAQGYLGCTSSDYYIPSIFTPDFDASNDSTITVSVKATAGTAGDYLVFSVNDENTYAVAFDNNGEIDATGVLPEGGKTMFIRISDYNYKPFMLDAFKVTQNLKKGDLVYTPLETATVNADSQSYTFNGLDGDYDFYAYDVKSIEDLDGETTTSTASNKVSVSLVATAIRDITAKDNSLLKVVARYGIDGRPVSSSHKGIQILKLSNGSIIKSLVK